MGFSAAVEADRDRARGIDPLSEPSPAEKTAFLVEMARLVSAMDAELTTLRNRAWRRRAIRGVPFRRLLEKARQGRLTGAFRRRLARLERLLTDLVVLTPSRRPDSRSVSHRALPGDRVVASPLVRNGPNAGRSLSPEGPGAACAARLALAA